MPPTRQAGLAMPDVLLAILLLAMGMAGACAGLIRTLQSTHDALLATRAVDLATDLAEQLQFAGSAADVESAFTSWRTAVAATLPVAGMAPDAVATLLPSVPHPSSGMAVSGGYELTLHWRVRGESRLQVLRFPVVAPHLAQGA